MNLIVLILAFRSFFSLQAYNSYCSERFVTEAVERSIEASCKQFTSGMNPPFTCSPVIHDASCDHYETMLKLDENLVGVFIPVWNIVFGFRLIFMPSIP